MTSQFCEQEAAAIRAARSGKWDPSLRAHVESCAVCREAVKVVSAMNSLMVADAVQIPSAPDPRLIWLKTSFAERQKRSGRIAQVAGFAYAVLAAAVGFGIYSMSKSQFVNLKSLFPSTETATISAAPMIIVAVSILIVLLISSAPAKRSS